MENMDIVYEIMSEGNLFRQLCSKPLTFTSSPSS